jgi:hypothetical protein
MGLFRGRLSVPFSRNSLSLEEFWQFIPSLWGVVAMNDATFDEVVIGELGTRRRRGMGGHQSADAGTHTWLTPPRLLQALGVFDLDPCAAPAPRPWNTAKVHYTAPHQDGLQLDWFGRVWLNPPYGNEAMSWLSRLSRHGRGTALIFARTETEAFSEYVFGRADALFFLRGRLFFHYPDGRQAPHNAGAPSVLCAYGPDDAEILHDAGLAGHFIGLKRPVLLHLALFDSAPAPGWKEVVRDTIAAMGGRAKLSELYDALENHPRATGNIHWREKVRQTVGRLGLKREGGGQYALAV